MLRCVLCPKCYGAVSPLSLAKEKLVFLGLLNERFLLISYRSITLISLDRRLTGKPYVDKLKNLETAAAASADSCASELPCLFRCKLTRVAHCRSEGRAVYACIQHVNGFGHVKAPRSNSHSDLVQDYF